MANPLEAVRKAGRYVKQHPIETIGTAGLTVAVQLLAPSITDGMVHAGESFERTINHGYYEDIEKTGGVESFNADGARVVHLRDSGLIFDRRQGRDLLDPEGEIVKAEKEKFSGEVDMQRVVLEGKTVTVVLRPK
jgi:hypothetical protein